MVLFKKTVADQDWLAHVLPLYESARPIVTAFSEAFSGGCREELNGAVGKVLHELPSLTEELGRLPRPKSRAARVANQNLRRSLNAYLSGARELDDLFELSARGLRQAVSSHSHTGELFYGAHLNAIRTIAGKAARLMTESGDFFAPIMQGGTPAAPQH